MSKATKTIDVYLNLAQEAFVMPDSASDLDCHFDLTENLNECENKSEHTEKNLNLTTKIELLYRNFYHIQNQKNLNFVSGYLNFTKFHE